MKVKRKKGYFSISAVAKMFSVHQQTVRLYEKEGLITPKRSSGNTRLFSEEDIDRLEEVIYLTHELGINLAGVEMILKLKKQIKKMQDQINQLFESANKDLDQECIQAKQVIEQATKRISSLKNDPNIPKRMCSTIEKQTEHTTDKENDDSDIWKIEYEE
jgi:MerR family transcriptional regulator, heat shock protein HspR